MYDLGILKLMTMIVIYGNVLCSRNSLQQVHKVYANVLPFENRVKKTQESEFFC